MHTSMASIAGTFAYREVTSMLTTSYIPVSITASNMSHEIFVDEFILYCGTTANQSTTFLQLCGKQRRALTTQGLVKWLSFVYLVVHGDVFLLQISPKHVI